MVVTCEIHFDRNPFGTYFGGQVVNGTVTLKADKPKDVKGVLLKISGYAYTSWQERHFARTDLFFGREDYLSSLTYLMGSDDAQRNTIKTGVHTFDFAVQLPYNCPSSFEGSHGCIRYVAKVMLKRPWKFDQTYSRGFTVLKLLDLNYESAQLKIPSRSENYKVFCCGPCKTEPLKMEIRIPQTGFVPGQNIPVNALIINNTNITVKEVKFYLVMLVRYFSQTPRKHVEIERIVMTEAKGDSVLRNSTRSLTMDILVPATPPTCVNLCNIIQIVYQIEVEAKMKGLSNGSHLITMPVTIGNVPFWNPNSADGSNGVVVQQPTSSRAVEEIESFAKSASADDVVKQPPESNGSSSQETPVVRALATAPAMELTNLYPSLPPPTYEESMHTVRGDINEDELHAFGPCEFAPLYPVYNISKTTTSQPTENNNGGYVNQSFEG